MIRLHWLPSWHQIPKHLNEKLDAAHLQEIRVRRHFLKIRNILYNMNVYIKTVNINCTVNSSMNLFAASKKIDLQFVFVTDSRIRSQYSPDSRASKHQVRDLKNLSFNSSSFDAAQTIKILGGGGGGIFCMVCNGRQNAANHFDSPPYWFRMTA